MLKKVTITNYLGEEVEYKLEGVDVLDNNGLLITDIDGLGPTGANINMTTLATINGEVFNSKHIEKRNIVIKAIFTGCDTIEEARYKSYKFFPLGEELKITIETDKRIAYAYGRVEKNEPDIFSPQSAMSVSIVCGNPYFYDEMGEKTIYANTVEPLLEFEYSNNGDKKNTILGELSKRGETSFYYKGDTQTGCKIVLRAMFPEEGEDYEITNPSITNIRTGAKFTIDTDKLIAKTGKGFINGDQIIVSTMSGNKSCYLMRDRSFTNILNSLGTNPKWPTINPGDNRFLCTASNNKDYLSMIVKVQATYEGV